MAAGTNPTHDRTLRGGGRPRVTSGGVSIIQRGRLNPDADTSDRSFPGPTGSQTTRMCRIGAGTGSPCRVPRSVACLSSVGPS